MIRKAFMLLTAFVFLFNDSSAQGTAYANRKLSNRKTGVITIEVQIKTAKSLKDSLQVDFAPVHTIGLTPYAWHSVKKKPVAGNAHWNYYANDISFVKMPFMAGYSSWYSEAGDSVVITIDSNNDLKFSGVGADKFILQHAIKSLRQRIKAPTKEPIILNAITFTDYFNWINVLTGHEREVAKLINAYKGRVSGAMLDLVSDREKDFVVSRFKDLFYKLCGMAKKDAYKVVTIENVCTIYDTTIADKLAKWMPFATDGFLGTFTILKLQVARKYKFQFDQEPLKSKLKRTLMLYEEGLKVYKKSPLSREQFLTRVLTEEMLHDVGMTPEIGELLSKYYEEPGYPEYKEYVKRYELKRNMVRSGKKIPDLSFTDINGNLFTNNGMKGKIVLMDFWFTGCAGCVDMVPVLKKIENEFKGDTNVVFLSISADKDRAKWAKSISEKKYTTGDGVHLYTNGNGFDDYTLRALAVSSYPTLFLIDHENKIVENPLPDPRKDNGEYLIDLIRRKRLMLHDGPYVIYEKDAVAVYSVNNAAIQVTTHATGKKIPPFQVQTDLYNKYFSVTLKANMQAEPAEFGKPEKLLALSDIEGNFDALRKILQSNGVIDEHFNWTFGKGHVVFNGDMFDRGEQVTECLWLIYSLEEKAKAAGGYVHYILGNHEIMNLSGNHKYVRSKYAGFAAKTGRTYAELFNGNTELGCWLRTKNIMEKIGDLLFVHAGISPEMNKLPLSIVKINEIARPYYDKDKDSSNRFSDDAVLSVIFDEKHDVSPYWYRSYYLKNDSLKHINEKTLEQVMIYKAGMKQIDETLKKYQVNHIVTGHTLIEPEYKLTVHYNGKVINTDTRHASGISEALLVEGKSYYRVNEKGNRSMLFKDN